MEDNLIRIGVRIIVAIACGYLAKKKNRSEIWIFAGLFFSVLALFILACLPTLHKQTEPEQLNSDVPP